MTPPTTPEGQARQAMSQDYTALGGGGGATPPTAAALAEELAKRICDIDGLCIAACPGDPDLTAKAVQPETVAAILAPALAKLVGEANSIAIPEDGVPSDKWLRVGVHQILEMRDSLATARAENERLDNLRQSAERYASEFRAERDAAVKANEMNDAEWATLMADIHDYYKDERADRGHGRVRLVHSLLGQMRCERDESRAEAADLRERVERAEADTRRLDWLESECHAIEPDAMRSSVVRASDGKSFYGDNFREAIDAAQSTLNPTQK